MERDPVFYGRHIFEEALSRNVRISRVSVLNSETERWANDTVRRAKFTVAVERKGQVPPFLKDQNHQGLWFSCRHDFYHDFNSAQWLPRERVLLLNHLEDPQNLGALVRSAAAFGFGSIVHERERSVSVTPAAVRASAGLAFAVKFFKVSNLKLAVERLRQDDFSVIAIDGRASQSLYEFERPPRVAMVLGAEGSGIAPTLLRQCDEGLRIPMAPGVNSLNVAQAGAIAMAWLGDYR